MNIRRSFCTALLFLALSLILSACYPDGSRTVVNADMNELRELAKEKDGIAINEDMLLPAAPESVNIIKSEMKRLDDAKGVGALFIGDKKITEEEPMEGITPSDAPGYFCRTEDGYWCLFFTGSILFVNNTDERLAYVNWYTSCIKNFCLENIFQKGEVEGFPPEEAISAAQERLDAIGLTNCSLNKVYAITAEEANACEEIDGVLSKEEECYILNYEFIYDDIPAAQAGVSVPDRENIGSAVNSNGTYIDIVVRKDKGIIYFKSSEMPDSNYQLLQSEEIRFDSAAAFRVLLENSEKKMYPIEYYDCRLVYIPVSKADELSFTLEPAWQFAYRDTSNDMFGGAYGYEYVNALTGNPI